MVCATALCLTASSAVSAQDAVAPAPAPPAAGAPDLAPEPTPSTPTAASPEPAPATEPAPPPGYAYPPPGYAYPPQGYPYPPPGYGYPPQGYAYPPQGYAYPPPGYANPPPGHWYPHPQVNPAQMPGYHSHDGFYMRLAVGIGAASAENSDLGDKRSGGSFAFSTAVGGAIAPNLILYGEVVGFGIPEYRYEDYGRSGTSTHTLNITGVGPGMAYYFMPLNLYVSGTFLLHQISESIAENSDAAIDLTDFGAGFSLMVGKEWWISADWGLGVAAEFFVGSAKSRNYSAYEISDTKWTSKGAAIMFSATYN